MLLNLSETQFFPCKMDKESKHYTLVDNYD